jgi:demethylmenaquinone methyltransferase/2-methoxy-6-polyprenyl-1,4-benzoquinol methylase
MVRDMFDRIAPRYDLVNRVMTFGLDQGWRRHAVACLGLPARSLVLDLACGTGDLVAAARSAGHRPVGADLSFGMLAAAPPGHGPAVQADAVRLPFGDGSLDGVVSGFGLRNLADLPATLAEVARVVRPGGRLSILEVDTPASPLLRIGHAVWFRSVVPRLGALLSDGPAYGYLPRSVAYLPTAERLAALLEAAGFRAVAHQRLTGGVAQLVCATRADDRS